MRLFWVTLLLSGALALLGCGEDGSENPRSRCLSEATFEGSSTDFLPQTRTLQLVHTHPPAQRLDAGPQLPLPPLFEPRVPATLTRVPTPEFLGTRGVEQGIDLAQAAQALILQL